VALEKYMIPCLFKTLFGFDCLGCGFQRALFLLFKGDFLTAYKTYPAVFSMLLFFGFIGLHFLDKSKNYKKIIWIAAIVNITFVLGGYYYKHFYL